MTEFSQEAGMLHKVTVGPRDLLYVPATWVFYERVGSGSDFAGVHIKYISKEEVPSLEEYSKHVAQFAAPNQPNSLTQNSLDHLYILS